MGLADPGMAGHALLTKRFGDMIHQVGHEGLAVLAFAPGLQFLRFLPRPRLRMHNGTRAGGEGIRGKRLRKESILFMFMKVLPWSNQRFYSMMTGLFQKRISPTRAPRDT